MAHLNLESPIVPQFTHTLLDCIESQELTRNFSEQNPLVLELVAALRDTLPPPSPPPRAYQAEKSRRYRARLKETNPEKYAAMIEKQNLSQRGAPQKPRAAKKPKPKVAVKLKVAPTPVKTESVPAAPVWRSIPAPLKPVAAPSRPVAPVLAAPAPQSAQELLNGLRARGIAVGVEMCNETESKAMGIGAYSRITPSGATSQTARFTVSGGVMLARDWEALRRHRSAIVALLGAI